MPQDKIQILIILAVIAWSLPWKGVALWKAARNSSKVWFIILLLVNTAAILDILYIFVFFREKSAPEKVTYQKTPRII